MISTPADCTQHDHPVPRCRPEIRWDSLHFLAPRLASDRHGWKHGEYQHYKCHSGPNCGSLLSQPSGCILPCAVTHKKCILLHSRTSLNVFNCLLQDIPSNDLSLIHCRLPCRCRRLSQVFSLFWSVSVKRKMVLSWTGKGKLCRGRSAQNSPGAAHQSQFNLATPVCVSRVFLHASQNSQSDTQPFSQGVFGKQSG